jgi:hypothetical protein
VDGAAQRAGAVPGSNWRDEMTTDEMRKGFGTSAGRPAQVAAYHKALTEAANEIDRLQRIIDSRPAINAGLPETYIEWSQGIYSAEFARVVGHDA